MLKTLVYQFCFVLAIKRIDKNRDAGYGWKYLLKHFRIFSND